MERGRTPYKPTQMPVRRSCEVKSLHWLSRFDNNQHGKGTTILQTDNKQARKKKATLQRLRLGERLQRVALLFCIA